MFAFHFPSTFPPRWREAARRSVNMSHRVLALSAFLWAVSKSQDGGIRVLRSDIRLGDDREEVAYSGAKLVDRRRVKVRDVTFCVRFNFQLLGENQGRSRIITIEDFRPNTTVKTRQNY